MKYKPNCEVKLMNVKKPKLIVEVEYIHDTWIYYMSDGTSYAESQIEYGLTKEFLQLMTKLKKPQVFNKIFDTKKTAKAMSEWYKKNAQ
jgi:hypothetical protein